MRTSALVFAAALATASAQDFLSIAIKAETAMSMLKAFQAAKSGKAKSGKAKSVKAKSAKAYYYDDYYYGSGGLSMSV